MKNLLCLVLLSVTWAQAQTTSFSASEVPTFTGLSLQSETSKSIHEFAVDQFQRASAYYKQKYHTDYSLSSGVQYMFSPDGKKIQSFSVDTEGHIVLNNITAEDALLLLLSEKSRERLEEEQRYDEEEKVRNDAPPTKLITSYGTFNTLNISDWTKGSGVVGTTSCFFKQIKIVDTNRGKKVTLLHEAMHVATHCNPDPKLHSVITEIAYPLLRILRENPDLVAYLMQGTDYETEEEMIANSSGVVKSRKATK